MFAFFIIVAGNSSTLQTFDETTPKDYTSSESFSFQSIFYTNPQNSEGTYRSATNLQTEKVNPTYDPLLFNSSSLTQKSTSLKMNTFATKTIPFQTQTKRMSNFSTDRKSSTTLKTEISTSSTSIKRTDYVFRDSPISTQSTTPTITSLETSKTQSTSIRLQSAIPSTKKKTTIYITEEAQATNTPISTSSATSQTAKQYVPVFVSNTVTTDSNVTLFTMDSSSAVVTSNTESIILSSITMTSITKTYNLRPRKGSSTMAYKTTSGLNTIKDSFIKQIKENISGIHTSSSIPPTTDEDLAQTTELYNRFIKPTENNFRKIPELNGKITSSRSMVKGIVSIIIVIALVLFIVSLACYIRKQRGKRQFKYSDDSDMRFLTKSDYTECSNSASLNGIPID